MIRRLHALSLAAAIALTPATLVRAQTPAPVAASFGRYAPALAYRSSVVTSDYVTMRDGVRIAVSVTRPAVDGKPSLGRFPVIWTGSLDIGGPNGDGGPINTRSGRYGMGSIVGHGYVVVTVARRGSGASFGTRRGYHDRTEAYDAYELTEWMARQPWSDGKVGVYGCSNTGEAVLHSMSVLPPSLKAAFSGCFSWNKFDGFTRGGIIANWGTGPTRTIEEDMRATPVQADKDRRLLRAAAEEHQGSTNLFDLMVSMPHRDTVSLLTYSRFWAEGSASSYAPQLATSGVALYIQGGWKDDFRAQGLIAQANLPNRPKVIIGDWTHCATTGFEAGVDAEALRFFDHYLKGKDTGIERDDPVHYFTVNAPAGREWRSSPVWPLANTDNRLLYFAPGGALAPKPGRAAAVDVPLDRTQKCATDASPTQIQPCHLPGNGASWSMAVARDTEITGHPLADVWITSDAPEEHIFAYLEDVAPDGSVTVVTEGRLRASLRKLHDAPWKMLGLPWHRGYKEDAQPLVAGEPARLQFDMLPASWVFRAGHKIQITVTGWDPRERQAPKTQSRIRVLNDAQHRSGVTLPFIPTT